MRGWRFGYKMSHLTHLTHLTLLNKLGLKPITSMSELEIYNLVAKDRDRRSQQRALGRLKRVMKDAEAPNKARVRSVNLSGLGLSPALITRLRSSGRSDSEILATLKQGGFI
jgi:hypothetical protein